LWEEARRALYLWAATGGGEVERVGEGIPHPCRDGSVPCEREEPARLRHAISAIGAELSRGGWMVGGR